MTISEKLREVIVTETGVDPDLVVESAEIVDVIGYDALDQVEVLMAIEEAFGVDIQDEDAEGWRTVGDIIRYLEASGVPAESDG